MDNASYNRSWPVAGNPLPSSSISFGMTLVMAIACRVAAAKQSRQFGYRSCIDPVPLMSGYGPASTSAPTSVLDAIAEARDSAMISTVVIEHGGGLIPTTLP
jgi:hypothetical protein